MSHTTVTLRTEYRKTQKKALLTQLQSKLLTIIGLNNNDDSVLHDTLSSVGGLLSFRMHLRTSVVVYVGVHV